MSDKTQIHAKVVAERPTLICRPDRCFDAVVNPDGSAAIPADWTIFNAPRPLNGHITWQDDFRHGIFYAAVNPHGYIADTMIRDNVNLHAFVLDYVGMVEVEAWCRQYAADNEISWEELDFSKSQMQDAYLRHFNQNLNY